MANWEKLNKEFDEALDLMTKEDWKSWYERFKQKQINQNRMEKSSIEKLHEESSELISKHLNGVISARELITMHHNLYYDYKEMHKQEIIDAHESGVDSVEHGYGLDYYNETFKSE